MSSTEVGLDVTLIEQVNARTTFALDGLLPSSPEAFADCFTEDGHLVVNSTDGKVLEDVKGRELLIKTCARILNPENARHLSLNVMIDVDGDTALLRAYGLVLSIKVQPRTILRSSIQTDTLVRGPDGWRITKRVLTLDVGGIIA